MTGCRHSTCCAIGAPTNVEPVKHHATIAAAFDVEDQWHVAQASIVGAKLGRSIARSRAADHQAKAGPEKIVEQDLALLMSSSPASTMRPSRAAENLSS